MKNFSFDSESFFHKIRNIIGYKDIDFDTHPNFSKNYLLNGEDENAIRNVFNEGVLYFFENKKTP